MSFLGLDIGKKRIGMAIGSIIAEEFGTLVVKEPAKSFLDGKEGTSQAILNLKKIIDDNRIEKIIVGLPLNENGTDSIISNQIKQFCQKLTKLADVPLEMVDESLTSFVAEEMLKEEGVKIKDAKLRIDQVAAKLILQQYLENE